MATLQGLPESLSQESLSEESFPLELGLSEGRYESPSLWIQGSEAGHAGEASPLRGQVSHLCAALPRSCFPEAGQ